MLGFIRSTSKMYHLFHVQCLEKISICHILEPSCEVVVNERRGLLLHRMPMHDEIARRLLQSAPPLGVEPWCRVIFPFISSLMCYFPMSS